MGGAGSIAFQLIASPFDFIVLARISDIDRKTGGARSTASRLITSPLNFVVLTPPRAKGGQFRATYYFYDLQYDNQDPGYPPLWPQEG